jgi:hypothetical protein
MTQLQQEIWERFLELISEDTTNAVNAYKLHQNKHQQFAVAMRNGWNVDVIC